MPTQYKHIERLLQKVTDAAGNDPILSRDYRLHSIRKPVSSVQQYERFLDRLDDARVAY